MIKTVVITGASAGVGRAAAQAFAKQGCRVALLARGRVGLDACAREVEELGGEALVIPTDVANAEQVQAAAERVEETWGPIDVWVNNAMVSVFSPIVEMTADEFRRVTEVTYLGSVYGTLAALRSMRPRNRGVIVQVGSALAKRSIPLQGAYCAAKHAMAGFTESLRVELMHDRSSVKVTFLELPAVNTPQFDWSKSRMPNRAQPVPPIFQPEVIAEAIVYAAAHPRKSFAIGFPTIKALFAEKFVPGFADWYLSKCGYESQQTDEKENPKRASNLWHPIEKDFGSHGRFDDRARSVSWQWWLNEHRALVLSSLIIISLIALEFAFGTIKIS